MGTGHGREGAWAEAPLDGEHNENLPCLLFGTQGLVLGRKSLMVIALFAREHGGTEVSIGVCQVPLAVGQTKGACPGGPLSTPQFFFNF